MTDLNFSPKKLNYKKFGLSANPFPYAGIPDKFPDIYVGQDAAISSINRVIQVAITSGKSSHLIITGSYGNGKSHTLKYLQSKVKENLDKPTPVPIASYIAQPGVSFLDIYRECIYDLGMDFLQNVSRLYIGKVCYDLSKEGLVEENIESSEGWKAIEEGRVLLSDVIPQALIRLNRIANFPDFARAFINLSYDDNSITSWEWLCGENIEYSRRRELKLTTNIGTRHAQRAFIALKNLLSETGFSPFLLLIDEFEYLEALPKNTKHLMLNTIRHLIDSVPSGLSVFIACAPEIWETLLSEYHAFSERIAYEVNLRPLTEENVSNLIIAYLNRFRIKPSSSIEPFTSDGIYAAFENGHGNARRIITICSLAIDRALVEKVNEIDQGIILSIVDN